MLPLVIYFVYFILLNTHISIKIWCKINLYIINKLNIINYNIKGYVELVTFFFLIYYIR